MQMLSGYQLIEKLYQGRHASIYRGISPTVGSQSVIVKIPNTKLPNTAGADKLRREFELHQRVASEYIVNYLALLPDTTYGVILVEEDDQADVLTEHIPPQGFELKRFLEIAIQLAKGLKAIHQGNVIHKDIKPSNMIIQPETGQIKYLDFGSASLLRQSKQTLINPSISEGTLAYISPEQTGRTNRLLDYRTDFYSLGVTLYQLLCGQLPFTIKQPLELIYCHIAQQPKPPCEVKSSIPIPLSDIILKLLNKDADDRYQSTQGLLHDLQFCLDKLQTEGEILPFILAQQDFSDYFYIPQKLYGREQELSRLTDAFHHAAQGKSEVCLIAGPAGSGKSALVNELQPVIAAKKGLFLVGKFEQFNRNIAYSAIIQAFRAWIKQLLVQSEEEILYWKNQWLAALNNQGQIIIDIVPEIQFIIGEQPPIPLLETEQNKNRFHLVFQNFIRVIATPEHPLVLFLDDWQWADKASLNLLELIMLNNEIQPILLIGAYRDKEVNASHPMMHVLEIFKKTAISIQTFNLSPLNTISINAWMADMMRTSPEQTFALTELLIQKTAGNPFFIKAFLQALYEAGLFTRSEQGSWQWDLSRIRQYPATDNVIELMTHQIKQLPLATQEILIQASCLGHRFTLKTLQELMQKTDEQLLSALQQAIDNGFLLQIESTLQFAHDRIQEAAYQLIPKDKLAQIHYSIGQLLQSQLPTESSPEQLFEVINHLNQGETYIIDTTEQLEWMKLNLVAGKKAKCSAAYADALHYLRMVENTLPATSLWQDNYSLALELYKELVEVEYWNEHFEASEKYMNILLIHASTALEKAEVYNMLIIQKTLRSQYQAAVDIGYQALNLLGIELSAQTVDTLSWRELEEVKNKLKDKTIDELLTAPLMTDVAIKASMKLLDNLRVPATLCNFALRTFLTVKLINLTLRYGNTEESAIGYIAYGELLCLKWNDIPMGYRFGSLALQLSNQFDNLAIQCRVHLYYINNIHHWVKPLVQVESFISRGEQAGLAAGEFQYLGYIITCKTIYLFYKKTSLVELNNEFCKLLQLTYIRNNQMVMDIIQGVRLVTLNLLSQTLEETIFQDDKQSDYDYLTDWHRHQNPYVLFTCQLLKAQTLYLYGHVETALEVLLTAKKYVHYTPILITGVACNYYHSLILISLYLTANHELQQQYWRQVEDNQKQMKIWAEHCPENFLHKYLLVAAEMARIQEQHWEAIEHYDKAIHLAYAQEWIQDHALACELFANFWLAKNKPACAQTYLYYARSSYLHWGAKRKVNILEIKYRKLFKPIFSTHFSNFTASNDINISESSLALLDLTSILKASQTISSEIDLSKLLSTILKTIVENAGAQTGAFFMEEEGVLCLQAEYSLGGNITTLQKLPLLEWKGGTSSIIEYVKKTQETLLLGNAFKSQLFSQDAYIESHQIKSVLCLPIMKQQQLKGILYIENNLAPNLFTNQHVSTLLLLASQMAISLENAMLYDAAKSLSERLNLSLESANIGIWSRDFKTNEITADDRLLALWGTNRKEFESTHNNFMAMIHLDDRASIEQARELAIENNLPFDVEFRVVHPDKSIHTLAGRAEVYRNNKGEAVRMVGVNWDITQRKQLEQERIEALKQAEHEAHQRAEEAERHRKEQEEFVDTVCHEIRNPMVGIFGHVEFLKQTANDLKATNENLPASIQPIIDGQVNKIEESISAIGQCVKHQKTIIDDVLDLSKLEAGKVILKTIPFQLKQLIEEILQIFVLPLKDKHLSLHLSLPEQVLILKGDPDRFKVILMNLISNAIKFTEQGQITVELRVNHLEANQVNLELCVNDTGIGIKPEQQARLFQRFSRPVSSQYIEGSGLGLVIIQNIINLMGGTIEVTSEEGKGSQFKVCLPFETEALQEKKALSSPPALVKGVSKTEEIPNISKAILIVEDNKINQRILQKQLEQGGYQCSIANHGLEAVTACEQAQFDLILMDREMPIMDGIEATKKIRIREKQLGIKEIPIIGLSAYARQELVDEAKAVGMSDYVTKPYSRETLIQKIKKWTAEPKTGDKSTLTASTSSSSFFIGNPTVLSSSSGPSQTLPTSPR